MPTYGTYSSHSLPAPCPQQWMKPKVTQDPPASLKRKRDEDDDAAEAEHDVFRRQPSEDDRPVKRRNLGTAFTVGAPPPPPKPRAVCPWLRAAGQSSPAAYLVLSGGGGRWAPVRFAWTMVGRRKLPKHFEIILWKAPVLLQDYVFASAKTMIQDATSGNKCCCS